MNTIKFIVVVSIAMLTVELIYHQAARAEKVGNVYFSINMPDNWAYIEGSNTPESRTTGYGIINTIKLTPNEFSEVLLSDENNEKTADEGVIAYFFQDIDYRIKNAPLESYVKYQINNFGIQNITSQLYTTASNEKSVRIYANESAWYGGAKIVLYLVMHDKVPYMISYVANEKNYEKYLPEFEKIVKSFKFADNKIELENNTITNTKTNFSGANLTDYNANSSTTLPEGTYDECVRTAGKSFCDFLFRR